MEFCVDVATSLIEVLDVLDVLVSPLIAAPGHGLPG